MTKLERRCCRAKFCVACVVALGASACFPARSRVIRAADVGDPAHSRLTNTLYGEQAPAPISAAAIEDEAWPTRVDAAMVCVRIVERTGSFIDRPLSDWDIEVNDVDAPADGETITVADHSYRGERPILVASAVTKNALAALALTEPTTETFRVFERSAEVCGPKSSDGEIHVKATIMDGPIRTRWWEAFEWSVR